MTKAHNEHEQRQRACPSRRTYCPVRDGRSSLYFSTKQKVMGLLVKRMLRTLRLRWYDTPSCPTKPRPIANKNCNYKFIWPTIRRLGDESIVLSSRPTMIGRDREIRITVFVIGRQVSHHLKAQLNIALGIKNCNQYFSHTLWKFLWASW